MCGIVTDIVVFTLASWVAYWTFEGSSPVSKAYLPSLSGPGARRFSPAALHVSSPRSEESKDWPQLGAWWHMWATVTRVPNIPASHWSVCHNTRFLLAFIPGDLIARHLSLVARDEKSQVSTLTLASCLVTMRVILDLIGSLFQDWHPYTWMIEERLLRTGLSGQPNLALLRTETFPSLDLSRTYTGNWSSQIEDVTYHFQVEGFLSSNIPGCILFIVPVLFLNRILIED